MAKCVTWGYVSVAASSLPADYLQMNDLPAPKSCNTTLPVHRLEIAAVFDLILSLSPPI